MLRFRTPVTGHTVMNILKQGVHVGIVTLLFACAIAWDHDNLASAQEMSANWKMELPGQFPQTPVVDAKRSVLAVASKAQGVVIYRLGTTNSPPTKLVQIQKKSLGNLDAMDVSLHGNLLFVSLGDFFAARGDVPGVAIVDIANLRAPSVKAIWKSDRRMNGSAIVRVNGQHVFLGAMSDGVIILEATKDFTSLRHITTYQPDVNFPRRNPTRIQHPNARGMWIENDKLYLAYDGGGLRVIDIRNPGQPREIGRYINAGMRNKQQAYSVWVHKGLAYVAIDYAGLEIIDVRDPSKMRQVGWWNPWSAEKFSNLWFNSPGHTNQIYFDEKELAAYLSAGDSELLVVDVSDPAHPQLLKKFGEPKNERGSWGITATEDAIIASYITSQIPFRGRWSGIMSIAR